MKLLTAHEVRLMQSEFKACDRWCEQADVIFVYPSDQLIGKLAKALDADAADLLILAKKIPPRIRRRVLERPDAFRKLADLDDEALDRVLQQL
jgi:hypothetical protein